MTEMKNKKILKKEPKQKIKKKKSTSRSLCKKKLNIIKILYKIVYYMFKNTNYLILLMLVN